MDMHEKVKKIAKHCAFPPLHGSGGSKSRLATAAGAGPSRRMRNQKVHAAVARRKCESQDSKKNHLHLLVELEMCKKVHAVVARSRFGSKSKREKHTTFGPLLVVQPSCFAASTGDSAPLHCL